MVTTEICDRLVRSIGQLPSRDIALLAAALDVFGGLARFKSRATSPIIRIACEMRTAATGTSEPFVAGVLLGVLSMRREQQRAVDVV